MDMELHPMPDTDGECFTVTGSWDIVHIDDLDQGFLAYHRSWDRLIPCINRIRRLKEYPIYGEIRVDLMDRASTWESVVLFIDWYEQQKDSLPAVYYKNEQILILGNRLRVWLDVPPMDDFSEYPPVKRYLQSPLLRERRITSLTVRNDVW